MLSDADYQRWLRVSAPADKCLLITLENSEAPIYISSRAYISGFDDALSCQPFRDCLIDMPEMTDAGSVEIGDLAFVWPGRADDLRALYWRGYPYEIRIGSVDWSYDDFRVVASGFIEQISRIDRDSIKVDFASAGMALEQSIAETRVNDILLPVCIGSVRNVSPVKPDSEASIYYVHDGAVDSVSVRVNGNPVSPSIDFTSGKITFSGVPDGTVTADVTVNSSSTVQSSIQWLAARREITSPEFNWLDDDQLGAEVGIYLSGSERYDAVIAQIAESVGAEPVHDELGNLQIVGISFDRDPDLTLIDDDIESFSESGEVRELSEITLNYQKNYNQQSDTPDYQNESLSFSVVNESSNYPDRWQESLVLDSALINSEDAQIEIDRVAHWRFSRRIKYSIELLLKGSQMRKGHRVRLLVDSWELDVIATVLSVQREPGSNRYTVECIS